MTRTILQSLPLCALFAAVVWSLSPAFACTVRGYKAADNVYTWGSGRMTHIRLDPVEGQEHVAELTFKNARVHTDCVETEALSIDGLSVSFTADVGKGNRPDFVDVEVPDGFIAVPPSISVHEQDTGRILIYPYDSAPAM